MELSANQAGFGSGRTQFLRKASSKGLVLLNLSIYLSIEFSLGRPNPLLVGRVSKVECSLLGGGSSQFRMNFEAKRATKSRKMGASDSQNGAKIYEK